MKEKRARPKIAAIALAGVLCASGIGGAYAYQSGVVDTLIDAFAIGTTNGAAVEPGSKALVIKEPNWEAKGKKQAEIMKPDESAEKDPRVWSNVAYDGYVMIKTTVPVINAKVSGGDMEKHTMVTIGSDRDRGTEDIPGYNDKDWIFVMKRPTDDSHNYVATGSAIKAVNYYFLYNGGNGDDKGILKHAYKKDDGSYVHPETSQAFDKITVPDFTEADTVNKDTPEETIFGDVDVVAAILGTDGQKKPTGKPDDPPTKTLIDIIDHHDTDDPGKIPKKDPGTDPGKKPEADTGSSITDDDPHGHTHSDGGISPWDDTGDNGHTDIDSDTGGDRSSTSYHHGGDDANPFTDADDRDNGVRSTARVVDEPYATSNDSARSKNTLVTIRNLLTGDSGRIIIFEAVMLIAATGIAVSIAVKRHRQRKQKSVT